MSTVHLVRRRPGHVFVEILSRPHALARGTYLASLPPRGPVFVSVPMDDWDAEADPAATDRIIKRHVAGAPAPDPDAMEALAVSLEKATRPVMIAGAVATQMKLFLIAVRMRWRCGCHVERKASAPGSDIYVMLASQYRSITY